MKANFVIFAPCFKHLLRQKDIKIVSERFEYEYNKL